MAIYRHDADDEDTDDLDLSDGEENVTPFHYWQGHPDGVPSEVPAETGWEQVCKDLGDWLVEEEPAAAEPAAGPAADAVPLAAVPLLGVLD